MGNGWMIAGGLALAAIGYAAYWWAVVQIGKDIKKRLK